MVKEKKKRLSYLRDLEIRQILDNKLFPSEFEKYEARGIMDLALMQMERDIEVIEKDELFSTSLELCRERYALLWNRKQCYTAIRCIIQEDKVELTDKEYSCSIFLVKYLIDGTILELNNIYTKYGKDVEISCWEDNRKKKALLWDLERFVNVKKIIQEVCQR